MWAAVYGVTQSQTRLKRLSSSSSSEGISGEIAFELLDLIKWFALFHGVDITQCVEGLKSRKSWRNRSALSA